MSSRTWTVVWGALMLWNVFAAYSAYVSVGMTGSFWLGCALFAYSAYRFSQGIVLWHGTDDSDVE